MHLHPKYPDRLTSLSGSQKSPFTSLDDRNTPPWKSKSYTLVVSWFCKCSLRDTVATLFDESDRVSKAGKLEYFIVSVSSLCCLKLVTSCKVQFTFMSSVSSYPSASLCHKMSWSSMCRFKVNPSSSPNHPGTKSTPVRTPEEDHDWWKRAWEHSVKLHNFSSNTPFLSKCDELCLCSRSILKLWTFKQWCPSQCYCL